MDHFERRVSTGVDQSVETPKLFKLNLENIIRALKNSYTRTQWEMKGKSITEEEDVPREEECLSLNALMALGITINPDQWPLIEDIDMHMQNIVKNIATGVIVTEVEGVQFVTTELLLKLIKDKTLTLEQAWYIGAFISKEEVDVYLEQQLGKSQLPLERRVKRPSSLPTKNVHDISQRVQANTASQLGHAFTDNDRGYTSQYPFHNADTSEGPFLRDESSKNGTFQRDDQPGSGVLRKAKVTRRK